MKLFLVLILLGIVACGSKGQVLLSNNDPEIPAGPVSPPAGEPQIPLPQEFNSGQFSGPGAAFSASPKYSKYGVASHVDGRTLTGNKYRMKSPEVSFGQREMQTTINALQQLSEENL